MHSKISFSSKLLWICLQCLNFSVSLTGSECSFIESYARGWVCWWIKFSWTGKSLSLILWDIHACRFVITVNRTLHLSHDYQNFAPTLVARLCQSQLEVVGHPSCPSKDSWTKDIFLVKNFSSANFQMQTREIEILWSPLWTYRIAVKSLCSLPDWFIVDVLLTGKMTK